MASKFLVTAAPGAPVPGVGDAGPTEIFTAPPGYVPSITMKAVNQEAVADLAKRDWKLRWNEAEAYLGQGKRTEARTCLMIASRSAAVLPAVSMGFWISTSTSPRWIISEPGG